MAQAKSMARQPHAEINKFGSPESLSRMGLLRGAVAQITPQVTLSGATQDVETEAGLKGDAQ
jgi:hypothetical protein